MNINKLPLAEDYNATCGCPFRPDFHTFNVEYGKGFTLFWKVLCNHDDYSDKPVACTIARVVKEFVAIDKSQPYAIVCNPVDEKNYKVSMEHFIGEVDRLGNNINTMKEIKECAPQNSLTENQRTLRGDVENDAPLWEGLYTGEEWAEKKWGEMKYSEADTYSGYVSDYEELSL